MYLLMDGTCAVYLAKVKDATMQESFATSQVQETILFCHVDLIVLGFFNESSSVVSIWLGWLVEF